MSRNVTVKGNPFVAAVLAYLVPGAGHFYLGRKLRGAILFVTICATFWTGMFIGGPLTVDYYNDRIWFFADVCAGAQGLYGWQRQKAIYAKAFDETGLDFETGHRRYLKGTSDNPGDEAAYAMIIDDKLEKEGIALSHMPTVNVARPYAGIAGMLNLLCIMDAVVLAMMGVYGEPPPDPKPKEETP